MVAYIVVVIVLAVVALAALGVAIKASRHARSLQRRIDAHEQATRLREMPAEQPKHRQRRHLHAVPVVGALVAGIGWVAGQARAAAKQAQVHPASSMTLAAATIGGTASVPFLVAPGPNTVNVEVETPKPSRPPAVAPQLPGPREPERGDDRQRSRSTGEPDRPSPTPEPAPDVAIPQQRDSPPTTGGGQASSGGGQTAAPNPQDNAGNPATAEGGSSPDPAPQPQRGPRGGNGGGDRQQTESEPSGRNAAPKPSPSPEPSPDSGDSDQSGPGRSSGGGDQKQSEPSQPPQDGGGQDDRDCAVGVQVPPIASACVLPG